MSYPVQTAAPRLSDLPEMLGGRESARDSDREPAIPKKLGIALAEAQQFRERLEELQRRLTPAMGPERPANANGHSDGIKPQSASQVADVLDHIANVICGGNVILSSILDRLEI